MTDYKLISWDSRPGRCKEIIIRNVEYVESTPRHYVFHTANGKTIKRRTDTWKFPEVVGERPAFPDPALFAGHRNTSFFKPVNHTRLKSDACAKEDG